MFNTQLRSSNPAGRARLVWVRRISGLIRTPVFDPHHSDRAFVVVYDEKRRSYEVEAFQPSDGTTLWSSVVPNGGYGAPAVREGQIVVLSRFTDVTALDTNDGTRLWTYETQSRVRSPINVIDDLTVFTSGGELIGLDINGEPKLKAYFPGTFFFGLCVAGPSNSLLSLGTYSAKSGESRLMLFSFERDGTERWTRDLGIGDIASSDTSGILVQNGIAFVGAVNKIIAVNANDGHLLWEAPISQFAHRSICNTDDERIYATTVDGDVTAFDQATGEMVWSRHLADEGIWMPVSIIGDRLLVEAGGVLQILDTVSGMRFQEIPVGHCPYSACALRDNQMLLGGGDPPYFGLLFSFLFTETPETGWRCFLERQSITLTLNEAIDLTVTVEGTTEEVASLTMDLSSIGGEAEAQPYKRAGNTFVFTVQPGPGRHWGIYALPVHIVMQGSKELTTVRLELREPDTLPMRVLLTDVPVIEQESPNFSGAACIQALRALYGDEVQQKDIRNMVDKILEHAPGYSPFQLWRIIARRAMLTSAHTAEEMPEFQ